MGLDMYLTGRKSLWNDWNNPENDRKEDNFRIKHVDLELGYWRKHPNLHGYIVENHADGQDDCQEIYLDADAIRDIIRAIEEDRLPETSGFFFGKSDGEKKEEDLKIFRRALEWALSTPPAKPLDFKDAGAFKIAEVKPTSQKEFRDVVYQASW